MTVDRTAPLAGVVLAAGASTRLGRNKLLLELGSETIVRRAARLALESGLDPVIVVLGHEAEQVAAALHGLPILTVLNQDYMQGINTSVQLGITSVPAACPAAVVILADMPLVTADMITALVKRFRAGSEPLVLSSYGVVTAPPTVYDRSLFAEFATVQGDGCGRRITRKYRSQAATVAWPETLLADLDVEGDLERVLSLLAEQGV